MGNIRLELMIGESSTLNMALRYKFLWAVIVAQLVEQSLPIPEVRGLNPVIGKNLFIY